MVKSEKTQKLKHILLMQKRKKKKLFWTFFMCVCVRIHTRAGVWSHNDDAVLCSSELTAGFGDEVLLCTRQTCRDTHTHSETAADLVS